MTSIDLSVATDGGRVRNLSGKEKGLAFRGSYKLNILDDSTEVVEVSVPEDLYAISPSFFLGLFSNSVKKLGKEQFLEKYKFDANSVIMHQINIGINESLTK